MRLLVRQGLTSRFQHSNPGHKLCSMILPVYDFIQKKMSESQIKAGKREFKCLAHDQQRLFSCLCSKVTVYRWKWQCCCFLLQHLCQWHLSLLSFIEFIDCSNSREWSLGHAEQLLFSCLCSKVTVYRWKWQCFFLTASASSPPDITIHRAGSQLKINKKC